MALYHHCAAHTLNLAVLSACKIMAFKNTESYIGEMARFLYSANVDELGTDWNWDGETLIKANAYIHQLESSSFLISFKILLECLTHLRSLTVKLQMQAMDVLYAYSEVNMVLSTMKTTA